MAQLPGWRSREPETARHLCISAQRLIPVDRTPRRPLVLNLQNTDLNLLVTLDLLLEERSVTRAATRAGVTQSAMSHTLRRLRAHFDDPLLVRSGGEMKPTAFAETLSRPVKRALNAVRDAFEPEPPFEPLTSRRTFTVATADLFEAMVLPGLMRHLSEHAPRIDLRVVPIRGRRVQERLETGDVDVAIGVSADLDEGRRRLLYRQDFACMVRSAHPDVRGSLDLDTYARLPHLLISPRGRGGGVVDTVLEERGRKRRVALRVPSFLLAPWLIATSDMVVTAPRGLCDATAPLFGLRVLEPPVPLPGFDVFLGWHERTHESAPHRWLRATLVEVTKELR